MCAIKPTNRSRVTGLALSLAVLTSLGAAGAAPAHPPPTRQEVEPLPVAQALEPALTATPEAECGPRSQPEGGTQGRVPREDHVSGRAAKGYTCNTELVGAYTKPNPQGTVGGFKVERYVDAAGHDCAYYDTTLLAPTSLIDVEAGVNVLDMSDPSNPVLTDTLVTPAMLSPHESVVVSQQARGARRRTRQPEHLPGHRRHLRHLRGLPPPGAQGLGPDRHPRPRERHGPRRAAPSTPPRRPRRRWSRWTSPTSRRRSRSGSGPMTPTASRSQTTATVPTSPGSAPG